MIILSCVCGGSHSECQLGSASATELAKLVRNAKLVELNLSGCPLSGATDSNITEVTEWANFDSKMAGFESLCRSLNRLSHINVSGCHLGPQCMEKLRWVLQRPSVSIRSLTTDSTGDMQDQLPYTLQIGAQTVDVSGKNFGEEDTLLLAQWMLRPAAIAMSKVLICDSSHGGVRSRTRHRYMLKVADPNGGSLRYDTLGLADIALLTAWFQGPEISSARVTMEQSRTNMPAMEILKDALRLKRWAVEELGDRCEVLADADIGNPDSDSSSHREVKKLHGKVNAAVAEYEKQQTFLQASIDKLQRALDKAAAENGVGL